MTFSPGLNRLPVSETFLPFATAFGAAVTLPLPAVTRSGADAFRAPLAARTWTDPGAAYGGTLSWTSMAPDWSIG